jgi:hypothetical protein
MAKGNYALLLAKDDLRSHKPPVPTQEALDARLDLVKFGEFVRPGIIAAPHHIEWCQTFQTGIDSQCLKGVAGPNTEILASRGSGKSVWAAIFIAFVIGLNPSSQILYLSNTDKIALRQSRIIKRIIESPQYRMVFPHIKPGKRWSDTDWEIDKKFAGVSTLDSDATFSCAGILGSIVGMRTTLIFLDDLIKSSATIAKYDVRLKMIDNLNEVIYPTLIPGGRIIDIGTRFRRDDVHATEFTAENGWTVLHQKALITNPDGSYSVYWNRFKLDMLLHIKARTPTIFTYQFQNELPPPDEDVTIRPEWIIYRDLSNFVAQHQQSLRSRERSPFDRLALGIDLATSTKSSGDMTAMYLLGVRSLNTKYGNHYHTTQIYSVLDKVVGKWVGNHDKLLKIAELYRKWGPFDVALEAIQYQVSLKGDFDSILVKQWGVTQLKCIPLLTKNDKKAELEGVSGIFSNNLLEFDQNQDWSEVSRQLIHFGEIKEDDHVDGLRLALKHLQSKSRTPLSLDALSRL